jgi:hypothetical protein
VVETELVLNPDDPGYDGEAVSSLAEAVEAYIASHPHIDSVDFDAGLNEGELLRDF